MDQEDGKDYAVDLDMVGGYSSSSTLAALDAAYPIALLVNQIVDELLMRPPATLRATGWTHYLLKRRISSLIVEAAKGTEAGGKGGGRGALVGEELLTVAFHSTAAWSAFERAVSRACRDCRIGPELEAQLVAAVRVRMGLQGTALAAGTPRGTSEDPVDGVAERGPGAGQWCSSSSNAIAAAPNPSCSSGGCCAGSARGLRALSNGHERAFKKLEVSKPGGEESPRSRSPLEVVRAIDTAAASLGVSLPQESPPTTLSELTPDRMADWSSARAGFGDRPMSPRGGTSSTTTPDMAAFAEDPSKREDQARQSKRSSGPSRASGRLSPREVDNAHLQDSVAKTDSTLSETTPERLINWSSARLPVGGGAFAQQNAGLGERQLSQRGANTSSNATPEKPEELARREDQGKLAKQRSSSTSRKSSRDMDSMLQADEDSDPLIYDRVARKSAPRVGGARTVPAPSALPRQQQRPSLLEVLAARKRRGGASSRGPAGTAGAATGQAFGGGTGGSFSDTAAGGGSAGSPTAEGKGTLSRTRSLGPGPGDFGAGGVGLGADSGQGAEERERSSDSGLGRNAPPSAQRQEDPAARIGSSTAARKGGARQRRRSLPAYVRHAGLTARPSSMGVIPVAELRSQSPRVQAARVGGVWR